VLREQVVGEKEEGPHLAAVSCRGILCQIGLESCTLDLKDRESRPSHTPQGDLSELGLRFCFSWAPSKNMPGQKVTALFFAFPDKFGVGGPLIERTRLWYRLDGKRIAV
jgi:hypothetical protein